MPLRCYLLLCAAGILCAVGCRPQEGDSKPSRLSTPSGMARYLEKVPAVREVESWPNEYGRGITFRTAHYRVYTTLLEPLMLRQIPALLESGYAAYQAQLPEPIDTQEPLVVYLFGKRSEWEEFTREFTGPMSEMYLRIQKGAYFTNGACVAYHIGRTRTFGVLTHEGWHQFNSRHFTYRLPSWLDEGIATTLETPVYTQGEFVFDATRNLGRLAGLKETIATGNLIPLQHLIALNPGYVIDDSANVKAFYSQAYALVRFLREEHYGIRLRQYQALLLGGLQGRWPLTPEQRLIAADRNQPMTAGFNAHVSTELFQQYIGEDLEELEEEYAAFCNKIVYHVRLGR